MTKRLSVSIGLIIAVCILVFIGWWFSDLYFAREIAPYKQTPDWAKWGERLPNGTDGYYLHSEDPTIPLEIRPDILLRTDVTGARLLLKHRYGTVIYMFDSDSQIITEASEQDWLKATGGITSCWLQTPRDYNQKITFNPNPVYSATINRDNINTYGRYVMSATESPRHTKVALVSAAGPKVGPGRIGLVGLGGSDPYVKGQRYVQILELSSGNFINEPIRITVSGENQTYTSCWTADEKYLVIYKSFVYEDFSIIETNKLAK